MRRLAGPFASLAGLLAASSCLPGGRLPALTAPPPVAGRSLGPAAEVVPDAGPLALAFASPGGDEVEAPLPTLVFTRAMHRLGEAPDSPPIAARIAPPVEGTWRWVDGRTAQFSPRRGFAPSTAYTIEVTPPASLDGQTLPGPVRLDFRTPRLALLDAGIDEGPRGTLRVRFNQNVTPAALLGALRVRDERGRAVAVEALDRTHAQWLDLRPRQPWPAGPIEVKVARGLVGSEGSLGLASDEKRTLREVEPATVTSLSCAQSTDEGECVEGSAIDLYLSAPLPLAAVRSRVRVTPPVPLELRPVGLDRGATSAYEIHARFRRGVTYTLEVQPSTGTPSRLRPFLAQGATLTVRRVPPGPAVDVLARGTYLMPSWTPPLQAQLERVERASFTVAPLDLASARAPGGPGEAAFALVGGATREVRAPGAWSVVGLGDLMPSRPGPVVIESRWEGGGQRGSRRQVLQRTDLALSVRTTPEGALVWVTRLSTGAPAPGARVELLDEAGRSIAGTVDDEGLVTLPLGALGLPGPADEEAPWRLPSLMVVARDGDDWMYTHVERPRPAELEGTLFTDRGLYRPGETVHIKGIVRRPSVRGLEAPAGQDVTLTVELPGGRSVSVAKTLSAWGTFDHELALPADLSPEGVGLRVTHGRTRVASRRVEVRHVRPASFKVQAALDRAHYVSGDEITCRGSGSYFHGGSLQGAHGELSLTYTGGRFEVPSLPGYRVGGREDGRDRPTSFADQGGRLDDGRPWELRSRRTAVSGPTALRCEAVVSDEGQQTARDHAAAWVHPAARYAAVAPIEYEPRVGGVLRPRVLAVTPAGERQAAPVRLAVRELLEEGGAGPETAVCEVRPGAEPASCQLPVPPRPGHRHELTATVADDQGRQATTVLEFIPREPPAASRPPGPRPARPGPPPLLRLGQERLAPGAVARVELSPRQPFRSALVTIEREGLFGQHVLEAGRSHLTFPVTDAMAPGVRVAVATARPLDPGAPHGPPDAQERASETLAVELPPRELRVEVRPSRAEGAPGDEVDVDVSVATPGGDPARAEVTVYAVDEGLLQLTGYRLPAPGLSLEPPLRPLVRWHETRLDLGWLVRPERGAGHGAGHGSGSGQLRQGATSVSHDSQLRSDFRPTPLFAPRLETGPDGHARARFRLPDSLTAYRVMAVAVGRGDHYGQAEAQVQVRLPAQIRPVFPPLVRAGDRFEAAAVASNNTDRPLEVTATAQAEGALSGSSIPTRLTLAPGESRRVTFAARGARVGAGRLSARLASADGRPLDGATVEVAVESPVTLEASALSGSTAGAVSEAVAGLGALRADVGDLELTVSTSPVAGLAVGLEQLVDYPHGCTEQTVSRLVPLLALRDLARALGVALPPDVDGASRRAVARLLDHRHQDGGFGLWPGSRPVPWVTTYAYWGLAEAQRRGLPVDPEVMAQGRRALSDTVAHAPDSPAAAVEACFALDVLAPMPDAALAHARTVARQLLASPDALPLFARALLLHALVDLGVDAPERAPLLRSVESSLHVDGATARAVDAGPRLDDQLDSRARTSALVLRALVAAAPDHPLREPLARGLVADRGPKGWRTTQETAWALLALDAYRRSLPPPPSALAVRAAVGPSTLLDATLAGVEERSARLPMADLVASGGAPLLLEARGGTAHYQARLRHAPAALPEAPLLAGFEVTKRCRPIDRQGADDDLAPGVTSFAVGQWVQCDLVVSTPSPRRFVAIDDPVPAGLEVLDTSLRGTPDWLLRRAGGQHDRRELRPGRVVLFRDALPAGLHRWSYVARAATAGDFLVPPTRVDEMYTPETFGRTAGAVVHIAGP